MNFSRKPGSVFVSVPEPKVHAPDFSESWDGVPDHMKSLFHQPVHPTPTPTKPEQRQRVTPQDASKKAVTDDPRKELPSTPPLNEVFAESLPLFIEASRWGRYVMPGPASQILDNSVLIYHNPCGNFWDLYELSKGIFRDLGIRVSKQGSTWQAHIPISVLTDKVFVESGLAAVEKTILRHTGIKPVAILHGIRERQFRETQDGIKRVKRNRLRSNLCETVGDVVGILAIVALSWATYMVL